MLDVENYADAPEQSSAKLPGLALTKVLSDDDVPLASSWFGPPENL